MKSLTGYRANGCRSPAATGQEKAMLSDVIFQTILDREANLRDAQQALDEVTGMANATGEMRDAAYEAVSALVDELKDLHGRFIDAVDAEEASAAVADLVRFDVPGTVTLNDVSIPAVNESYEGRVIRLAMKAVIQGCTIVHENAISAYVTSSQDATKAYWVGVDVQNSRCACECDGFQKSANQMCKHLALVLIGRGIVPATPAPDAVAA
jgi:hypothetical protein